MMRFMKRFIHWFKESALRSVQQFCCVFSCCIRDNELKNGKHKILPPTNSKQTNKQTNKQTKQKQQQQQQKNKNKIKNRVTEEVSQVIIILGRTPFDKH